MLTFSQVCYLFAAVQPQRTPLLSRQTLSLSKTILKTAVFQFLSPPAHSTPHIPYDKQDRVKYKTDFSPFRRIRQLYIQRINRKG